MSRWQLLNKAKVNANSVKWRKNNLEKHRAAVTKWAALNPEKRKASSKKRQLAHPERSKEYKKTHPEIYRIAEHNRRAKKRENGGILSKGLSKKLFILQRGRCPCCGKQLENNYQLDHKMPIALGGANEDWNMQLLRSICNKQKNAKHPIDFMQERGYLL